MCIRSSSELTNFLSKSLKSLLKLILSSLDMWITHLLDYLTRTSLQSCLKMVHHWFVIETMFKMQPKNTFFKIGRVVAEAIFFSLTGINVLSSSLKGLRYDFSVESVLNSNLSLFCAFLK